MESYCLFCFGSRYGIWASGNGVSSRLLLCGDMRCLSGYLFLCVLSLTFCDSKYLCYGADIVCDTCLDRALGSRWCSLCTIGLFPNNERIPHPCICALSSLIILIRFIHTSPYILGRSKIHAPIHNNHCSTPRRPCSDIQNAVLQLLCSEDGNSCY